MVSTTNPWWRTDAVAFQAHGWSLEVRGDEIAEIRRGGRMLVRGVRAAVRDHGWMTVPVLVRGVTVDDERLVLALRHEGLGALIESELSVHADAESLTIAWDAANGPAFDTCRAGLVVLHPAADAGRDAIVVHPDGSAEATAFPTAISPHQPMMDIRELSVGDDLSLEFSGDVFEMEDQRNWTDASFKTYSRPLALPYPYRLDEDERVRQSITIRAPRAEPGPHAASTDEPARVDLTPAGPFPQVGVEASTAPDPVASSSIGGFRIVELDLRTPAWPAALRRAAADRRPLDVRLVVDGDGEALDAAVRALAPLDVMRVTAFDAAEHVTLSDTLTALRRALHAAGLEVPILAGARSHFTELNREQHRVPRDVDGIAVNTTPLFHALDTEQLVESLAMQRLVALQTVAISAGAPVHIGPVSLRPRFNNVATTPEPLATATDLSEGYGAAFTGAVDPRQSAAELAAWTVASAAALCVPGVASAAWFETRGPRGVEASAAAEAVDTLSRLTGGVLLTGDSPDGLIWAIGARDDDGDVVLVANADRRSRRVEVRIDGRAAAAVDLPPGSWSPMRL